MRGESARHTDSTYIHSSALEEEGGLVSDQVAGEILRHVNQAGNDRSAKIDAFPQLQERRISAEVCFNLNCAFHHGESFGSFGLVLGTQPADGAHCFFFAATASEPPGRLGREEDEDHQWGLRMSVRGSEFEKR